MSASILYFTPKADLGESENIDAFIALCKQSDVLEARSQFDANIWNIGHFKGQNKANRVVFSSMEASKLSKSEPALPSPFLEFAKAVLVYLHDKRPVVSQAIRIAALRFLEASLRNFGKASRLTAVNEEILDGAVELARCQLGAAAAYRVAGQLELIVDLMCSKDFIVLPQRWGIDTRTSSSLNWLKANLPSDSLKVVDGKRGYPFKEIEKAVLAKLALPAHDADVPYVCLLDTGVNNGHPLLQQAIANTDKHSVEPAWGLDDSEGHGTEMAGLALLGNLTDALSSQMPVTVSHRLESVKLLPEDGTNGGDAILHGYLTSEAVDRPTVKREAILVI